MTAISTNTDSELLLSNIDSAPCALWLKSDSIYNKNDGDSVTQWSDSSGNDYHHSQFLDLAPSYKIGIFNNRWPSVRFDGSEYLQSDSYLSLNGPNELTIFAVVKNIPDDVPTGSGSVFQKHNVFGEEENHGDSDPQYPIIDSFYDQSIRHDWQLTTSSFAFAVDPVDGFADGYRVRFNLNDDSCNDNTHIVSMVKSADLIEVRDNDVYHLFNLPEDKNIRYIPALFTIGADQINDRFFEGDIGEIIVFDGKLDTDEFDYVNNYLKVKYCLPWKLPLFIRGHEGYNNSIPLYISTLNKSLDKTDLFIKGYVPGELIETGYGLFIQPTMSPNLFIRGSLGANSVNNIPLIIKGIPEGVSDLWSMVDLNLTGHIRSSSSTTLFVKGPLPANSAVDLYISGPLGRASGLNLSIIGKNPDFLTKYLPLSTYGSLVPTNFSAIDLSINGANINNKVLNLYIKGEQNNTNSVLNLVLFSDLRSRLSSSLDLFLMNKNQAINGDLELFIKGYGKHPGYKTSNNNLNLFIDGIPGDGVFVNPIAANNLISLFLTGGISRRNHVYDIVPLYLAVRDGVLSENEIDLFVSGAAPLISSANIPLVIYNTSLTKNLPLYIHGF
jgi:hypothetical protein